MSKVTVVTVKMSRPSEAPSFGGSRKAGKENIEGNESAHYEKLEKRSLKSLAHGGSEKELRDGHNFKIGDMFGASKMKDAMSGAVNKMNPFSKGSGGSEQAKEAQMTKNVKSVAKSGVAANKYLNPVLAARVDKRNAVKAAKASGGDVKAARQAGRAAVKEAKTVRAGFNPQEAKLARQSYKSTVKTAKNVNRGRDPLGVKY